MIFTANASGALRVVAESFPFGSGSRFVLTADNHNSVNGIRVRARRRGAAIDYVPLDAELRAVDPRPFLPATTSPSVFAFPAQSNFSGVRHPLDWVEAARERGYRVLLDAAAYLSTSRLSLTETPADFVALSFYKIFGYPTGVGALVVRRDAMTCLRRSYFGGGTVQFVSIQNRRARLQDGAPAFEDGTPKVLFRRGFKNNSLLPGTKIEIDGKRPKEASRRANGRDITFAEGRKMIMGSSGTAAPHEQTPGAPNN